MKNLFLIIILMMHFSIIAQESIKKNSVNLSTGIALGSSTSKFYGLESNWRNPPSKEDYPKDIAPALNYRFGLDYQRIIGRGFSLKAGVRMTSWNLTITNYSDEMSILNSLFLEIPLAVQYRFGQKKCQPYLELGLNPMFLLVHNNYSSSASFAIHMGLGLSYQVSSLISLYGQFSGRFQPVESISYSEHEIGLYSVFTGRHVYPFEIGLEIGLAFAF